MRFPFWSQLSLLWLSLLAIMITAAVLIANAYYFYTAQENNLQEALGEMQQNTLSTALQRESSLLIDQKRRVRTALSTLANSLHHYLAMHSQEDAVLIEEAMAYMRADPILRAIELSEAGNSKRVRFSLRRENAAILIEHEHPIQQGLHHLESISRPIIHQSHHLGELTIYYATIDVLQNTQALLVENMQRLTEHEQRIIRSFDSSMRLEMALQFGIFLLFSALFIFVLKALQRQLLDQSAELEKSYAQLRRQHEHLQKAQQQLVESEKMASLGQMVAGIAHEVKTPIGNTVTIASTLQRRLQLQEKNLQESSVDSLRWKTFLHNQNEGIMIILSGLQRAAELINSFKQLSIDQTSEMPRTIELKKYLDETLLTLRPELKHRAITIHLECDEQLQIQTYPGAISQVITNLISNALLHAYPDDQFGTIRISVTPATSGIGLRFEDDGIGMTQEVQEKIFDPFFTTKRGHGGSGLGLNIVYNLVTQRLQGTIQCKSSVDQGTVFVITIKALTS